MKYTDEYIQKLIQEFGDLKSGRPISRDIARLYSHQALIRAGKKGLETWRDGELFEHIIIGEKLLIAGLSASSESNRKRYLLRAGEIFEWSAVISPSEKFAPVVLLSASAYQLAGYPARASGVIFDHPPSSPTSKILVAVLQADFPTAQRLLLEVWQAGIEESVSENHMGSALLIQLLHAVGVLTAWLRWGDDTRIKKALQSLVKISKSLHYDSDRFSWLLSRLFAEISQSYVNNALWAVLPPIQEAVTNEGREALLHYARSAFYNKTMLVWPSQKCGISAIVSQGSFALCTPTGSGKTRVAELVILRHLFNKTFNQEGNKNPLVIYLAPSKALSSEVEATLYKSLSGILSSPINVTSFYDGNDFGLSDLTSIKEPTVLISTHEKADALLRFHGSILMRQISCVIIDEAHTVAFTSNFKDLTNSQSRSLRLEGLVNRLKTLCNTGTKFVALSAVATTELQNVLSSWMTDGDSKSSISPSYRSTRQLFGQLLCDINGDINISYDVLDGQNLKLYGSNSAPYVPNPFSRYPPLDKTFKSDDSVVTRMRAHLLWAAMHFAMTSDGVRHSVLISVMEHPEYYAKTFLDLLTGEWQKTNNPKFFTKPTKNRTAYTFTRCLECCKDYFGNESREYRLLELGIAFHHGKMPQVMSRLLIKLIRLRVINIVIATSTLSEGVNLPFETILIPSLLRGREKKTNAGEIMNIAGRAGRPGVSTEGKTLVLLSADPNKWANIISPKALEVSLKAFKLSQQEFNSVVKSMTEESVKEAIGQHSPLRSLMIHIAQQWIELYGSGNRANDLIQLIDWLEKTAYSQKSGLEGTLLTSLDTFDQQLLAGIEEAESLSFTNNAEDLLQALWHKTFAYHDGTSNKNKFAMEFFSRRGVALIKSIYPNRKERTELYCTGLPPRDGSTLITQLSDIKNILEEAVEYMEWEKSKQISHFLCLIDKINNIQSFRINTTNKNWINILVWWMAPGIAETKPSPIAVSQWFNFVSTNFIYRFNWALGSIINSILERDGGDGEMPERWRQSGLPWSINWYANMINWGTLDPIASCALSKNKASTRPAALDIANRYWIDVGGVNDDALDPIIVNEWMHRLDRNIIGIDEELPQSPVEVLVNLTEDFSKHMETLFRVLPSLDWLGINWYDPAGFLLAKSHVPENWQSLKKISEIDFILNPSKSIVTWDHQH